MNPHFEYLGEGESYPNSKRYRVEAIHVGTTGNMRKFTHTELQAGAVSLSYRPLDINHDPARILPFPSNATERMRFNPRMMAVEGTIRVSDPATVRKIESGDIFNVSIEQVPESETCNQVFCEQHGVIFVGLGLLEKGVPPGDSNAHLSRMESLQNLIVSDAQRTCPDCTDFEACHTCRHRHEQKSDCISRWMKKMLDEPKNRSMSRDRIIAMAASKCRNGEGMSTSAAWEFYRSASAKYESILKTKR